MGPHARSQFLLAPRKRLAQLIAVFFVCGAGAAHANCPAPVSGVITVSGSATTRCVLDGSTAVGLVVEDSGSIETSGIGDPSVDVDGSAYIENSGSVIHSRDLGGNAIMVRPGVTMSHLTNQAGGLIEGAPASGGSNGIGVFVDTNFEDGDASIEQLLNEAGASILGTLWGIENNGTIDELINDGLIRGGDAGIGSSAPGRIVTLRNRGSIEGDVGIYLLSDIDDLINHGLIEGSGVADILGEGFIAYLENAQAGLRLQADLPGSYAVLIDGESAGGLTYLGMESEGPPGPGGDECLEFGIAPDSNVTQTNYPNVLSGVDPCSTTGVFQNRNWTLQPTALLQVASGGEIFAQDSHTSWDLSFGDFIAGPTPIPSLSHLAMGMLAALMALVGLRNRRWRSF